MSNGAGVDVLTSHPELRSLRTAYSFAGRELDSETGMYYNRARYYDPSIGRFLQKDTAPGSLGVPSSVVNSYAYTANNPQNHTDPSGLSWFSDNFNAILAVVIVAVFVVLAVVTAQPEVIGLAENIAATGEGLADAEISTVAVEATSGVVSQGIITTAATVGTTSVAVGYAAAGAQAAAQGANSVEIAINAVQAGNIQGAATAADIPQANLSYEYHFPSAQPGPIPYMDGNTFSLDKAMKNGGSDMYDTYCAFNAFSETAPTVFPFAGMLAQAAGFLICGPRLSWPW